MALVRLGLIGWSSIARRRTAPALGISDVARLKNIGRRAVHKAEEFAREFNCSKWGSYECVLTDPNVDMFS